ncbi:MAG: sulfatase-like hydrolase/transferase [Spirochaetaceae bacterium]|nr:sulfatase-like hydrolase/transferase [Spirochaetaceae bacterium]
MPGNKNIIYIMVDQQRFDMLGAYGNTIVKTPNIDKLKDDGILFTNAFTPTAICGPARTSLFTGLVPTSHGVVRNAEENIFGRAKADPLPGLPVLTDFLEGYEKIYLGKWHISETKLPRDYGFSGHNFAHYGFPGTGVYKNLVFNQGPGKENNYYDWLIKRGFDIPVVSDQFFGNNPNLQVQELRAKLNCPVEATIPSYLADEAIDYTDKTVKSGNPFFLWLNFWGPHTPCMVPEPYYSMYDPLSIPEDPAFNETFEHKPIHQKHVSQMWGVNELDWEEWQKIIARYFGYISLIDAQIGRYIDYLIENDLYEDSLIVFTADHGDAMGSNRLIEKGEFMYDTSYKIPMIIKQPGNRKGKAIIDEFVYLHDLFPTAIEAAEGVAPVLNQAKSLLPLLEGKTEKIGRDYVYGQFTAHFVDFHQRMIRTARHKFIFNSPAEGELYDLEKDPCEMENLIDNPQYSEVKRKLIDMLLDEMKNINDPAISWLNRIKDVY